MARLKLEVLELREKAAREETEARILLAESRQHVDKVTAGFFAGARNWGDLKLKLKQKEKEVAQLKMKLEMLELDEAAESEDVGVEERSLSITITTHNSLVGPIIGRRGENIKRIRDVSQVNSFNQQKFAFWREEIGRDWSFFLL